MPGVLPLLILAAVVALVAGVLAGIGVFGSKGEAGEHIVTDLLAELDPATYRVFHDLYLPCPDGSGSVRIHHVVTSSHGIFVVHTRDDEGWIFGRAGDREWTQCLHQFKSSFPNPLDQNQAHVEALAVWLGISAECFENVVFFVGEAEIRTSVPNNVVSADHFGWILAQQDLRMTSLEAMQVSASLEQLDRSTNRRRAGREYKLALARREAAKGNAGKEMPQGGGLRTGQRGA